MSKQSRVNFQNIILISIVFILLLCWGSIFLVRGVVGVVGWWTVQFFSFVGSITLVLTIAILLIKLVKKQKIKLGLITLLFFSAIAAWPMGWFFGIGRIAYPADIQSVKPAVYIRLPINQPALVGWGGDSLETNYHVMVPCERWAYDLLVPPAAVKSSRLEDYGIFGVEVVAPAAGRVVAAHDGEPDIAPGDTTSNFKMPTGNHVYIRLDETNTYLVIAHLKKGSVLVQTGQHVEEGAPIGQAGNSGNTSEPHIHIHHQRQDPSKTSIFLAEGLPLYFREIDGPSMPEGGIRVENGIELPAGQIISPINKPSQLN